MAGSGEGAGAREREHVAMLSLPSPFASDRLVALDTPSGDRPVGRVGRRRGIAARRRTLLDRELAPVRPVVGGYAFG
jgi:hypothetical protein